MILTDLHTHTTFSADGSGDMLAMLHKALQLGVRYYGISEHVNYDYDVLGLEIDGKKVPDIDLQAYFQRIRALQEKFKDQITLLAGLEFGYNGTRSCLDKYMDVVAAYQPDFIINSIHTCLGEECYFPEYTQNKSKRYAYSAYFDAVLESLDAPYPYDVVAHIGYCSRNAVYPDPKIRYEDYADILDKILKKIIEKDKILEFNSSSRTAGSSFLPDIDIAARYFDLGGRKVSFGSDAHDTPRIAEKHDIVVAALKKIGFTHFTLPNKHKHIQIAF